MLNGLNHEQLVTIEVVLAIILFAMIAGALLGTVVAWLLRYRAPPPRDEDAMQRRAEQYAREHLDRFIKRAEQYEREHPGEIDRFIDDSQRAKNRAQ